MFSIIHSTKSTFNNKYVLLLKKELASATIIKIYLKGDAV